MSWLDEYKTRGYAKIPGVFKRSEINRLRGEAVMALTKEFANSYLQVRNGYPALMFWPSSLSPYIKEIRNDWRMQEIVRTVLGDNVHHLVEQIYYRMPGDGDSFSHHADTLFRKPDSDFEQIDEKYLQTIVVVDHMTPFNGTIEFVPETQSWPKGKWESMGIGPQHQTDPLLREFKDCGLVGEPVIAEPGDVLLWTSKVVHYSRKNETDFPRMTLMNGFSASEAVKVKNKFPLYLKDGVLA